MALNRDRPAKNDRWTFSKLDRLSENSDDLLSFLDVHGIVSLTRRCGKCGKDGMSYNERPNGQIRFRCGKAILPGGKKCNREEGLLAGSFMTDTKLPVIVISKYIFMWLSGQEQMKIAEEVGISKVASVHWNKFCRQVVYWSVKNRASPVGGLGDVEIDESKFGKRKYNRGHRVDG
uniref:Transposase n=1 Tax=Ditylenchus dipsaci TaxID=166011 RepID=A0A915DU89_9BILA